MKYSIDTLIVLTSLEKYIEVMTDEELYGILIGNYHIDGTYIERWEVLRRESQRAKMAEALKQSYAKQR